MSDNNTFKQHVRTIATEQTLSRKQLLSLHNTLTQNDEESSISPQTFTWLSGFYVGTIASVIATIILFSIHNHSNLAQQIANEAANNHIKLKPAEVESTDLNTVKSYFALLDFSPIDSSFFHANLKQLVGGRYSSIKGQPAAQFRYHDEMGQLHTLYQVNYDESKFSDLKVGDNNEPPITRHANGLTVKIWQEQGLMLASVSAYHPSK